MLPKNSYNWDDEEEIDFEEREETSRTYRLKQQDGNILGKCDEIEAVKQAIYLMLNIERYDYPIFSWNYGVEFQDLIGEPDSYCIPEIKRRITEALKQDERIESVEEFEFNVEKRKVHVTFVVHTRFGEAQIEQEVAAGV